MSIALIIHAALVLAFRLSLVVVRFEAFAGENENETDPLKSSKPSLFQKLLRAYVYFFWSFWVFQALAVVFPGVAAKLPFVFSKLEFFDFPFREAIGLFFMVLGLGCYTWAFLAFKKYLNNNIGGLLAKGPYGLLRHPLYAGTIVLLIGSMLTLPTPILLGSTTLCFLAFHLEANSEESELEKRYGTMYLEYKKKTKKLIPFIY